MEILFNQLEALSSLQGRLPSVVRCYEINLKGRVTVLFDAHKKKKKRLVFQMTYIWKTEILWCIAHASQ